MTCTPITWEDLQKMNLVGRDLEVAFANKVYRARIKEVGPDYFFVLPGNKCTATNFIRKDGAPWMSYDFRTHPITFEGAPCPEIDENGTIRYEFQDRRITIHRVGDNM